MVEQQVAMDGQDEEGVPALHEEPVPSVLVPATQDPPGQVRVQAPVELLQQMLMAAQILPAGQVEPMAAVVPDGQVLP